MGSGDAIFLTAHTGKVLDAGSESVQARYEDLGEWQRFVIENDRGGELRDGDTVSLKAYTGRLVDVEDISAKVRWYEQGTWQSFTIRKQYARLLRQIASASAETRQDNEQPLGFALGGYLGIFVIPFTLAFVAISCNRHSGC